MSQMSPPTERGFAPPRPTLRTGLAVTAMVLSLVGLCVTPLAIVGLTLGIIALVNANNQPEVYGGKPMAIAGISLGGVALLVSVMWIPMCAGIMLPALGKARLNANQLKSGIQLRAIGSALHTYSQSYDQAFPEVGADITQRLVSDAPAELFVSPFVGDGSPIVSYLYCAGQTNALDADTVLMFENPAINRVGINVLYQDGHVEFILAADIANTLKDVQNVQTPDGQPFTLQLPN